MAGTFRRKIAKALAVASLAAVFAPAAAQSQGYPGYDDYYQQSAVQLADYVHPTLASSSTEDVGTRIILYFDISGSIDEAEYQYQLDAMAAAIESDEFRHAVFARGGPGSVAIAVADYDTNAGLRIGWVDIRDEQRDDYKFSALADEIRELPRRSSGMTSQANALLHSATILDNCPWEANKTVIDILADGSENVNAGMLETARQMLTDDYEATINALVTITRQEPNLREWAMEELRTEAGHIRDDGRMLDPGFVKVVATQETSTGGLLEYNRAMEMAFRRKLILEVSGMTLEEVQRDMRENGVLRLHESPVPERFRPGQP